MENIILIIKEFEGILGTILGSITTLIVSDLLRKKGKLKTYLIEWQGKYETFRDVGCSRLGKEDSDFYDYSFSYTLQVYNKSDTPKIMRNFKVKFYKEKREMFSFIPNDEATRKFSSHAYYVDRMEVINIKPKEIQVLKQSGYINYEELNSIEESSKVELIYYDEKDKKRTIMLYKGIISRNNYISTD
jgi:hypothetical protein